MIIVYWILIFFSHLLPLKIAMFITEKISYLMYFTVFRRKRRIVFLNLKRVHKNISSVEARKLVFEIGRNFGKFIYEFILIQKLNKNNLSDWVDAEHLEYLDDVIKSGKGAMILTAHLGNWEFGAGLLGILGYSPTIIAFPQPSKLVKKFFAKRRESVGSKVVYVEEGLFRAISALKRGGVVTTVGDRVYSGPVCEAEFFGKPFPFPKGVFELARRTQASIVPAFSVMQNGKSRVYFEPPLKDGVEEWAKVLEKYIKKYTNQWFLFDSL